MGGLNGGVLSRRRRAGIGMIAFCFWFCACPHAVYLRAASIRLRVFPAKDRFELVGHGFDPIKMHKPIVTVLMAISDAIVAGGPTIFMVEEAQTNHLLGADNLLPAILTGSSYVDCVEFMSS